MLRLLMIGEEGFLGGAEIAMSQLLSGLRERGVECAAVVPERSDYWRLLKSRGVPLFPCSLNELKRDFIWGWPVFRELRRLRQAIHEFRPSVIHANAPWGAFFCLPAANRFGVPVVCALHSYPEAHRAFKRMLFVLLKTYIIRRCKRFVVFSDHMLNEVVEQYGFPLTKLSKVNCGIESERIVPRTTRAEWRMRNHLPSNAVVFLNLTRIHPVKGVMDFVDAAGLVRESCREAFFVIAGEEAVTSLENLGFTAKLQRGIEVLGMADRFRFLGFQDDVGSILAGSDVLVHPAHKEPFGLAVAEASAAGLPVVASRVGGIPETIVEGENGFLVAPRDVTQLAEKMLVLAADRGLRDRMGKRGAELNSGRFTVSGMVEGMLSIYEGVAG
ncbi:MAG: glycosyltransferase family 4 protein [Candidatus Coatesbacteria bacterium]|nr:glycosyltransferase family 4 protein [Candidatus Coatesbacteria bacterium]